MPFDGAFNIFDIAFSQILARGAAKSHASGDMDASNLLKASINVRQVQKEALAYSKQYKKDLITKGGTWVVGGPNMDKKIFKPWFKESSEEQRKTVADIIARGVKEGKPTGVKEYKRGGYPKDSIASELHDYFNARRSHASMVARTEVKRIQWEGAETRFKKHGVKELKWLAVGDAKTRQLHRDRNGKTYSIDNAPPLGEPNCRCTYIPVIPKPGDMPPVNIPTEPADIPPVNLPESIPAKYTKITPDAEKRQLLIKTQLEISKHPAIMNEIILTDEQVRLGRTSKFLNQVNGVYTEERQMVHNEIIETFAGKPATGNKPRVILFGGPSGSGKGGLKKYVNDFDSFNYINNDDIKHMLPGYTGPNAALFHDEASDVLDQIEARIQKERSNVIIDGTLKRQDKAEKIINKYRSLGYEVELRATNLPLEKVMQRNVSRLVGEGAEHRYVPLEMVIDTAEQANINQFEVLKMCDVGAVYDTDVEYGKPYKLIVTK